MWNSWLQSRWISLCRLPALDFPSTGPMALPNHYSLRSSFMPSLTSMISNNRTVWIIIHIMEAHGPTFMGKMYRKRQKESKMSQKSSFKWRNAVNNNKHAAKSKNANADKNDYFEFMRKILTYHCFLFLIWLFCRWCKTISLFLLSTWTWMSCASKNLS